MGSEPAGDGRGAVARGRRPAGSGTREAILAAAARAFAEQGYPRTTLRGIAKDAGVDTRLVSHYFGSKQELFVSVVELPFDPDVVIPALLGPGRTGVGFRLAGFAIGIMDTPEARQTMTGLLRAAASEEAAAVLVRDLLMERLLGPLPRLATASRDELVGALGPVLEHYLVGDLSPPPA